MKHPNWVSTKPAAGQKQHRTVTKFWLRVMNDLKNLGVQDILIARKADIVRTQAKAPLA
jgi:hypothetical protein